MDDVDREAVEIYRRALGTSVDDEKLLRSLGVLKDGHLTNAGMMLFGENVRAALPQARLRVLKIDGTEMGHGDKLRIIKDQTFEGPFIKSIPEARSFISSQLRDYQFQTHGTMEFKTVSEYPEYPWFEGLVNAVTHRDYSIYGEYIRVYIFDDRMLIQSPGKLPGAVTLENIRYKRFSRNPTIARVFTAFDWVRELNEGVDKIYQEMGEAGLPEPEYENDDDYYLKLTLRNNLEERIPRLRNEACSGVTSVPAGEDGCRRYGIQVPLDFATSATLSKNEIVAMRIAAESGRVTTKELAENGGITTRTASTVLKELARRNLLTWHGNSLRDPRQYYGITPKKISE